MERVLFAHRVLPALRPDVAHDPGPFSDWVQRREERRRLPPVMKADARPLHLVMVIVGEPPHETVETLHALQQQTCADWKLTVVLQNSWQTAFTALLAVSGLQRTSQRVRVECADDAAPNDHMLGLGLAASGGSSVALLFPGDVWAPDAVAQFANALSPRTVAYADEDAVTPGGDHVDPRLKPVYSPEFLLSSSYIGRPLAIGSEIVPQLTGLTGGSDMEHDLALRACELADEVIHLPDVLCHHLMSPADSLHAGAPETGHVMAALQRRGEEAEVTAGPVRGTYRVRRRGGGEISTTIIIPFRDEPRFLRTCIESIDATRGTHKVDYVLVDNGSAQPETQTLLERLGNRSDVEVLTDARPFNWSELNNTAARLASGEVFLFLNNDIEARQAGWIDVLSAQAMRKDVGAVGARLLYPDHRLQHCGVAIGLGGAADHLLAGLDGSDPGYLNMTISTRECAAVTGACLATRRGVFESLGGFDAALGIDLNDIDYCLRAQREGLRVLFEASAELIHHESPSRGFAGGARDIGRFIDRWRSSILEGDPYLSPHLTRVDSSCALRGPDEGGVVAPMVRKLLPKLSDQRGEDEHSMEPAPGMFKRHSDVSEPLPSIRHGERVATLHREWLRISTPPAGPAQSGWRRLTQRLRRVNIRGYGATDRELIADLIRAVDAVAARCDEISDRLYHQSVVLDDVVNLFGEELTRLRAEAAPYVGGEVSPSPPSPRHD